MSKKMSLQELAATTAASSNTQQTNEAVKTANTVKPANNSTVATSETLKSGKAKKVSINDIKATLPPKEKTEEDNKDKTPEILDNALNDMVKTLEEKKRRYDEEYRPAIEAARREAEIEAELAETESEEIKEPLSEEDELESMLEDGNDTTDDGVDEVEDVEVKVTTPKTTDAPVEHEEEPEEVKEKKPKKVAKKVETSLDEEISSIDSLLGDLDEEDLGTDDDIELEEEVEAESVEQIRERLKKQSSKLKATDSIDTSGYTVSTRAINSSSLLSRINKNAVQKTADWPLLATGKCCTFSSVTGPELEALQKTIQNSNGLNGVIATLRLAYNHIVDANKPGFEQWCKLTKYEDLESIYFGLYYACYGDVNLIGRVCQKDSNNKNDAHCGKTSIIDTPIRSMVKIEDEEAQKLFDKLLRHDTTTSSSKIESTILDISSNLAVGYSDPSLYNTLIQYSSLSDKILQKHDAMLNTMAYIDNFYYIDHEQHKYIPIAFKVYPDNLNKTIVSKLKVYIDICKAITSDEYDTMVAKISNNANKESKISYVLPETVCPECGETIPEQEAGSMLEMLFTHRQLTAIANS